MAISCRRSLSKEGCLPRSSTMSLSMPRGPSVVRTASAITWQALMLLTSCGIPCEVSVPSFSRITGVGWGKNTRQGWYSPLSALVQRSTIPLHNEAEDKTYRPLKPLCPKYQPLSF